MQSVLDLLTEPSWQHALKDRLDSDVIQRLTTFLNQEINAEKVIFPTQEKWFKALNELPLQQVKVVILGQDPYHGEGQAQGLSFSVPESLKLPPSLRNMFKEISEDVQINNESGDLSGWLAQGVLLLNSVLTVEASKAGSHAKKGWEALTDAVIGAINDQRQGVVFMLWGSYAQSKQSLIDSDKHCLLTAAHPSPLSAYRGWFGCQHFSKTNRFLQQNGQSEIDWHTGSQSQISLL